METADEKALQETGSKGLSAHFWIGAVISAIIVAATFSYIYLDSAEFGKMEPNEWSDFLAGISATLAFLWLILGFLQQQDELRTASRLFGASQIALRISRRRSECVGAPVRPRHHSTDTVSLEGVVEHLAAIDVQDCALFAIDDKRAQLI